MNKLIILLITLNSYFVLGQKVVETQRIELSKEYKETFDNLELYKDSGFYKGIEILEKGLINVKHEYEKYKIIFNLGYLYATTRQYDKSIDMWLSANEEGIFFPFKLKDNPFPQYLSEYSNNKRFQDFIILNDRLKNSAVENPKAEYFVNLPVNFNPGIKYPLIIILHGGIGSNNSTCINWDSKKIKNDFISVYPQGRIVLGSYARRYGKTGLEDIKEIYRQVISKYPVDTSSVILAGQSAGGELSLRLAYNDIPVHGLLLAFPVKPGELDYRKASEYKNKNIRIVMICGEKDQIFFPGQQEMSIILDSAKVENRFIKYPDLGHGFPVDFPEQLDKGILYITNDEY